MGRRKKGPMDNLERDSLRALELGYGVHYGRYKADHPHTAPGEEEPDYEAQGYKNCPECGKLFLPKRNQVRCSIECTHNYNCRKSAERQRRKKQRKELINGTGPADRETLPV